MRSCVQALMSAALTLAAGLPALAGPIPEGGVTASDITNVLMQKGYRAELGKASDGTPKITTSTEGSRVLIFFYTCDKGQRCATIQFFSGFIVDKKLTPV